MSADGPEAVIHFWNGMPKGFPTRTMYLVGFAAATALLAMVAVVTFGFDAAIFVIVAVGLGFSALVTFLSPPAWCERIPAKDLRVGDFVAAGDDDFVMHGAPVTAVTVAIRGAKHVFQVATASGSAYEVDANGSLPTIRLAGFVPRVPTSAMSAADADAPGPDPLNAGADSAWPWADMIAGLVARLLQHQRDGGSAPTRDQVRADLVARTRCTQATARYTLLAATGLGLVTHGRLVTVTPAGAVWSASRTHGIGSRIESPRWMQPVVSVAQTRSAGVDVSLSDGPVLDLSRGHGEQTAAVPGHDQV